MQNVFDMAKALTNSVRQDCHIVFGYSGVDAKYQDIRGKPWDSHQFDDLVKLVRSGGSVSRRSRLPTNPLTL